MEDRSQTQGGRRVRRRRFLGALVRCAVSLTCAAALAATTGCGPHLSQLSFRVDKRLHFVTPKDRTLVHTPFTVSWTMRDFTVSAPSPGPTDKDVGYFAIFVDRAPIRPGQSLKSLAKDDPSCRLNPKCPDAGYLALRQIYTTTSPSVTLDQVSSLTDTGDKTQLHDVTVVLLDTSGHRIGESAWHLTFKLKKRTF
jgi:hypothetical protein